MIAGSDLEALEKRVANRLRDIIVNRTLAGYDYLGVKFAPYTPEYAAQKGVGVDDVNLVLTGSMLDNFFVDVKLDPQPLRLVEGIDYFWFNEIEITYSLDDTQDGPKTSPLKKYYWNAQGFDGFASRITGGEPYYRHTPQRDFIGLYAREADELFTQEELNDIINELMI